MKEIIVSQLDAAGFFVCPAVADESPLDPGIFLLPAGCVMAEPPEVPDGMRARWDGKKFVLENIPAPEPMPEPVPPSPDQVAAAVNKSRRAAYAAESDPLFFKWQRDEGTKDAWLAKVAEIKARYPDGILPA